MSVFGYVKPDIPELKVKDNELYKATYCGLCKTMGKCTGCISRLTLNYDFVFLALVRRVLENVKGNVRMRRCMLHPLKKRPVLDQNDSLEYSSKTSAILTKLKLKDNINDSHGFSRLKAKIAATVSLFFKKTDESLVPLEKKVGECIDKLSSYEKENGDSVDTAADIFGELLAEVSSFGLDGANYRIAYDIGRHLGRWIYVIDACDDFSNDIKNSSFNPIVNAFGKEITKDTAETMKCALCLELEAMSKSVELIDFSSHNDVERIIKNVIYDGMKNETEKIISKMMPKE